MSTYDLSALKPALKDAVKQAIVENAPDGGAARVGELLIEGGARAGAGEVKVHGLPISCNTLGPVLMAMASGAGGLETCDISQGAHKTDDFAKINPYQQIPAMTDGDFVLGESLAIVTYLARAYAPQYYSTDPKKAARIDQAMQTFKNGVASAHAKVVYPFLGFTEFPDGGFTDEVPNLDAALAKWGGVFLAESKFVGGDTPCIADVVALPFLFSARHEEVKAECGFALSERMATYVADLEAALPAAAVAILSEGGFSLKEYITSNAELRRTDAR